MTRKIQKATMIKLIMMVIKFPYASTAHVFFASARLIPAVAVFPKA